MLKAEGYSYQEIGDRLSWTYTNVLCRLGPCRAPPRRAAAEGAASATVPCLVQLLRGGPISSTRPAERCLMTRSRQ